MNWMNKIFHHRTTDPQQQNYLTFLILILFVFKLFIIFKIYVTNRKQKRYFIILFTLDMFLLIQKWLLYLFVTVFFKSFFNFWLCYLLGHYFHVFWCPFWIFSNLYNHKYCCHNSCKNLYAILFFCTYTKFIYIKHQFLIINSLATKIHQNFRIKWQIEI